MTEQKAGDPAPLENPVTSLERSASFWEQQDPKCALLLRLIALHYPRLLEEAEGRFAIAVDGLTGERVLDQVFETVDEAIDVAENRGTGHAGLVHRVTNIGIGPSEIYVKAYPESRMRHRLKERRINEVYLTQPSMMPSQPQNLSRFKAQ